MAATLIVTRQIADDAITNAKIAENAITNAKIANNAITSEKIDAEAVTNGNIADGTITNAKISPAAGIQFSQLEADPVARANHTGTQASSTISDLATVVKAYRLDEFADPTAAVALNSQKITGLAAGTNAGDAVNYSQLAAVENGTAWKDPVRMVETSNIASLNGGTMSDGVSSNQGDRILLTGQTTASENGIWVIDNAGAWTRPADFAAGADAHVVAVFVSEGTSYADTVWRCTTDHGVDTVDTDDLAFAQFAAGVTYSADGSTLQLSGTTFSVKSAGVGATELASDAVTTAKILDANVTEAKIADGAVTAAKLGFSFSTLETPSGAVNGVNAAFTLANTPASNSLDVFLNGVLQEPGAGNDYTLSTATITFASAPISGDKIRCRYRY